MPGEGSKEKLPTDEEAAGDHRDSLLSDYEEEEFDEIIVPPDGGYGWIIVITAFLSSLIVDGTVFCFGVLIKPISLSLSGTPNFTKEYNQTLDQNVSLIAWVGSLSCGFYLCSGPIISMLAAKVGFRYVAIMGGMIAFIGYMISYAFNFSGAANPYALFACYGVIGGIGCGAIYLPSVLAVGFYFDRKRSLANGIALCGSGVGTFVFPIIVEQISIKFGWHNSLIFLALAILTGGLLGSLYAPIKPTKVARGHYEEKIVVRTFGSFCPGVVSMRVMRVSEDYIPGARRSTCYSVGRRIFGSQVSRVSHVPSDADLSLAASATSMPHPHARQKHEENTNEEKPTENHKAEISPSPKVPSVEKLEQNSSLSLAPKLEGGSTVSSMSSVFSYASKMSAATHPDYHPNAHLSKVLLADANVKADTEPKKDRKKCKCCVKCTCNCSESCKLYWSTSLLISPTFLLWVFSGFIFMLGALIPYVYLKAIAKEGNPALDDVQATFLISIIGIGSICGRLLFGWIGGFKNINPLTTYSICVTMMGVAQCIVPFIKAVYWELVIFSTSYGLVMGGSIAFLAPFLTQLLGLDKLVQAFGFTELTFGLGAMLGTPLQGYMREVTDHYDVPFYLSGLFLVVSAVMIFPINALKRWEEQRNKLKNEKEEAKNSSKNE